MVKAISGVQTVRFKNELERNITIKLGYANAKIYKCEDDACPRPSCYRAYGSTMPDAPNCEVPGFEDKKMKLVRHVSFVDCPGHDILMATMLNGAAVMDGALLLVAGNESCPQPQTSEHLAAVEIMRLKHIIILQNKIDLVQENAAANQYDAIVKFIQGTIADGAPVIPISAQLKYNIDVVCEYICGKIPVPKRDFTSPCHMIVIRSFDVNKPGAEVDDIQGGVAGGAILQGVLKVGQPIEVRPGIVSKDAEGRIKCTPISSRIVSLFAEQNQLKYAVPGGLIGVGTTGAGAALYYGLQANGVSAIWAGNIVQLTFVLGLSVAWVGSYVARVMNKDMTYVKQLKDYEDAVMAKRLEELPEAELEKMMDDISKLDPK